MSDGWAQASHEISYKPIIDVSLLEKDPEYKNILDDLLTLSDEIGNKDDALQKLKVRFQTVCDKYYRENKRR